MADMGTDNFLEAYGRFLVQSWGSPPLKQSFKDDPAKVLKSFGMDPEGAEVIIETPDPTLGEDVATPESQVKAWNEGKASGTIHFWYPEDPPEDLSSLELSDEDLEAIAGGWSVSCCCCSPCCCC